MSRFSAGQRAVLQTPSPSPLHLQPAPTPTISVLPAPTYLPNAGAQAVPGLAARVHSARGCAQGMAGRRCHMASRGLVAGKGAEPARDLCAGSLRCMPE